MELKTVETAEYNFTGHRTEKDYEIGNYMVHEVMEEYNNGYIKYEVKMYDTTDGYTPNIYTKAQKNPFKYINFEVKINEHRYRCLEDYEKFVKKQNEVLEILNILRKKFMEE